MRARWGDVTALTLAAMATVAMFGTGDIANSTLRALIVTLIAWPAILLIALAVRWMKVGDRWFAATAVGLIALAVTSAWTGAQIGG